MSSSMKDTRFAIDWLWEFYFANKPAPYSHIPHVADINVVLMSANGKLTSRMTVALRIDDDGEACNERCRRSSSNQIQKFSLEAYTRQ